MQKWVYPYEYKDDQEKFNEKSLPDKEDFYSHLKVEDITDADYTHEENVMIYMFKVSYSKYSLSNSA